MSSVTVRVTRLLDTGFNMLSVVSKKSKQRQEIRQYFFFLFQDFLQEWWFRFKNFGERTLHTVYGREATGASLEHLEARGRDEQ